MAAEQQLRAALNQLLADPRFTGGQSAPRLFFPGQEPQGVVLLLHGLNFRPDRMAPLERLITGCGWVVLRAVVTGHAAVPGELRRISLERWLTDLRLQAQVAVAAGLPCVAGGFSLGGLLSALGLAEQHLPRPELWAGWIGWSPALALHRRTVLLRLFDPLPWLPLPGLTPPKFRVHRALPQRTYRAVSQAASRLRRSICNLHRLPGLLFLDPRDRVISAPRTLRLLASAGLTGWRIRLPEVYNGWHHLIVESGYLTPHSWGDMTLATAAFLQGVR